MDRWWVLVMMCQDAGLTDQLMVTYGGGRHYGVLNDAIQEADESNRCQPLRGRYFVVHERELPQFGLTVPQEIP